MIAFAGFGAGIVSLGILQPGEWASGIITIREGAYGATSFILPHDGTLRSIYALFSTGTTVQFEEGSTIRPFVCLAVSVSNDLVFTILQDTITLAEPYIGGVEYPAHEGRRGSLTNLNIEIAAGTLIAIVTGVMGENVTMDQYGMFLVSGGLFIE